MGKDTRLVNIYIKIHNKRNLTIEDLNYLSKYDPECFEKTCRNVVYNVPDAEEVLQPKVGEGMGIGRQAPLEGKGEAYPGAGQGNGVFAPQGNGKKASDGSKAEGLGQEGKGLFAPEEADRKRIDAALSNLKRIEQEGLPVGEMDVDTVKNLLGSLYMEMLFPHTGRAKFFCMEDQEYLSVFNKKV